MQLLNRPIIDEYYLIIHTFRGATAHSSCVAGGVASLLLPNSAVEELLICLQWSRPHGNPVLQRLGLKLGLLSTFLMLTSYMASFQLLKMEAAYSSKISVDF
jgi:hypothetical protein